MPQSRCSKLPLKSIESLYYIFFRFSPVSQRLQVAVWVVQTQLSTIKAKVISVEVFWATSDSISVQGLQVRNSTQEGDNVTSYNNRMISNYIGFNACSACSFIFLSLTLPSCSRASGKALASSAHGKFWNQTLWSWRTFNRLDSAICFFSPRWVFPVLSTMARCTWGAPMQCLEMLGDYQKRDLFRVIGLPRRWSRKPTLFWFMTGLPLAHNGMIMKWMRVYRYI